MQKCLRHPLDLLVVVVVNLATMVEHVTDVGNSEAELVNGRCDLLIGAIPETAHGVLDVTLDWVSVRHAVGNVGHAVEVEGTDEEALDETSNLGVVMSIGSLSDDCNDGGSESTIHLLIGKNLNYYNF